MVWPHLICISFLNFAFLFSPPIYTFQKRKNNPGFLISIKLVMHIESLKLVSSSSSPENKPITSHTSFSSTPFPQW